MAISQNGYIANDPSLVSSRLIPGTTRKVTVRKGAAGDLLLWVAGQFDRRVEDIEAGQLDDWGYAERPVRGSTTDLSNHASGTAIDLNATKHPLGTNPTANFSAAQIKTIHAILAEAQGAVRWGGDYTGRKDGMHFEIVASEATCARVLAALNSGTAAQTEEEDMTPAQANTLVWLETAVRTLIERITGDPEGDPNFDATMKKVRDGGGFPSLVDSTKKFDAQAYLQLIDAATYKTGKRIDALETKLDQLLTALASKTEA